VTRTPLSRSKGQSHQAALLTTVLAHQAVAAVGEGTYWPWETAAMLSSARRRKAFRCLQGGEGRGHIVAAARLQLVCPAVKSGTLYQSKTQNMSEKSVLKVIPYSYSQPAHDRSHKPGEAVIAFRQAFAAAERHRPLARTKLYTA